VVQRQAAGVTGLPDELAPLGQPSLRLPSGQAIAPAVKEAGQATNAVPVEAPEGTDPALWSVLTSDERAFFAKVGAMGPLTYGYVLSQGRSDPPIARGGRLDIRV
jgi:hypothetical protein